MTDIPIDEVPLLPLMDVERSVSFGVYEDGIIIHYVERDVAVFISWGDIIDRFSHPESCINATPEIREVKRPVKP